MSTNYNTFVHSGNIGDIIYALPTIKALGGGILYINPCCTVSVITKSNAEKLKPLLLAQPYIKDVIIRVFNQEVIKKGISAAKPPKSNKNWGIPLAGKKIKGITYNLDNFRLQKNIRRTHLTLTFARTFKVDIDISSPWLKVPKEKNEPKKNIVVNLTNRYRITDNKFWKYILKDIPNIIVVGDKRTLKEARFLKGKKIECSDFLELAKLISSSKLFLGNQSFPNCIAESIKIKRAIEVSLMDFTSYPLSKNGYILPTDKQIAKAAVKLLIKDEISEKDFLDLLEEYKNKLIEVYSIKSEPTEKQKEELNKTLKLLKEKTLSTKEGGAEESRWIKTLTSLFHKKSLYN